MTESSQPTTMDTSLDAIRSALRSSQVITTNIRGIGPIDSNDRRDKYLEFLHLPGGKKEEFIGFMPLRKTVTEDANFARINQEFFSKGVHTPGRMYPFFGSSTNGVCISRRPDTVFTVIEEGVEYWMLVCAVAYDPNMVEQSSLFKMPSTPPQYMEWNRDIDVNGKDRGWKRHFDCIQDILYVSDVESDNVYPRNVLPIALAHVKFRRKERNTGDFLYVIDNWGERMEIQNVRLYITEMTTCTNERVFEPIHMRRTKIYSRYPVEDDEWPDRLLFNDYQIFTNVFTSWILNGKLNIEELLIQGNVKFPTIDLYNHYYRPCSLPHPSHVYLNYFEVEAPKELLPNMVRRMNELEAKDMILFACVPLMKYAGHRIYAAVPPGEVANRLGLPMIPRGRFHLIQALPVSRGKLRSIHNSVYLAETRHNFEEAHDEEDRHCWDIARDVVTLSSDDEERQENNQLENRDEDMNLPPSPDHFYNAVDSSATDDARPSMGMDEDTHEDTHPLPPPPSSLPSSFSSTHAPTTSYGAPDNAMHMEETPMVHHPFSSIRPRANVKNKPQVRPSESNSLETLQVGMSEMRVKSEEEKKRQEEMRKKNFGFSFEDDDEEEEKEKEMRVKSEEEKKREEEMRKKNFGFSFEDDDDDEEEEEKEKEKEENEKEEKEKEKEEEEKEKEKEKEEEEKEKEKEKEEVEIVDVEKGMEEGGDERKEDKIARTRRCSAASAFEEEEEEVVVASSSPSTRPPQDGFRTRRVSSSQRKLHSRTNALLEDVPSPRREESTGSPVEGAPPLVISDSMEGEQLVVCNREKRRSSVKSFSRLPPSAYVILVDDQLFKQMKKDELKPLIKRINESVRSDENRIIVVLHEEFDPEDRRSPRQVKDIDSSAVYIMKHKGETISNFQVECCDRVKKLRGNDDAVMVYLTPNVNVDLHKNIKLDKLGFKIYNISQLDGHFASKQYED